MALTLAQWHERFIQQARWTQQLRTYLERKCGITQARRILDVGCGTGVLEKHLVSTAAGRIFGVDLNFTSLEFAKEYAAQALYTGADGLSLPFVRGAFDVTFCHFVLLWIGQVQEAVIEMARVTRAGGYIIAMAEPDYGGRVDYPDELAELGKWQNEALVKQGANPYIGRRLRSIFAEAGLEGIESGVLGAQWSIEPSEHDMELEWQVLAADLADNVEFSSREDEIRTEWMDAHQARQSVLFVPVFYALGKVVK